MLKIFLYGGHFNILWQYWYMVKNWTLVKILTYVKKCWTDGENRNSKTLTYGEDNDMLKIFACDENIDIWWKYWHMVIILTYEKNLDIWWNFDIRWKYWHVKKILIYGKNNNIWWKYRHGIEPLPYDKKGKILKFGEHIDMWGIKLIYAENIDI